MPQQLNKKEDFSKLRSKILISIGIVLTVITWRSYEYFVFNKNHQAKIRELSMVIEKLYNEEIERSTYLLNVDFQGRTSQFDWRDKAPKPLIQANESTPLPRTMVLMKRLFDNYDMDTYNVERVTIQEELEEMEFLHAILETPFMKKLMEYLVTKGFLSDFNEQLKWLKQIWFTQYPRVFLVSGSSGFENVFMAEIKDQRILGLHSWLYFHEQEKLGNIDYKGYIDYLDLDKGNYHAKIRFSFLGMMKTYNTILIGTPPELEIGIYTACLLLSPTLPCHIHLGHRNFTVSTYSAAYNERRFLAFASP